MKLRSLNLVGRFFRRQSARVAPARRQAPPDGRAPDLQPEEVPWPGRIGFDGKPIEGSRGGLTGLEGGNAGGPKIPGVPGEPK